MAPPETCAGIQIDLVSYIVHLDTTLRQKIKLPKKRKKDFPEDLLAVAISQAEVFPAVISLEGRLSKKAYKTFIIYLHKKIKGTVSYDTAPFFIVNPSSS